MSRRGLRLIRIDRVIGLLFGLFVMTTLSGCAGTFGSYAQQQSFHKISTELKRTTKTDVTVPSEGILIVFDTNGREVTKLHQATAATAEAAMFAIMREGDPCAVDGPKPAVAAFAPPSLVDLPFSFEECSVLRDEVAVLTSDRKTLKRLITATNSNDATMDRLASDLAVINQTQSATWDQLRAQLAEMNGRPLAKNP